jgi:hypothetical protein
MHTCPDCNGPLVAFSSFSALVDRFGWSIDDADLLSVHFVCNNCTREIDENDLTFEMDGPPAFWERLIKSEALVRRAYEAALEDGNDEVTGPLAEALEWLDGKRGTQ